MLRPQANVTLNRVIWHQYMAPVGHGPKLTSVGQPHSSIRIYSGEKGWLKESTTDACYTNKKNKNNMWNAIPTSKEVVCTYVNLHT